MLSYGEFAFFEFKFTRLRSAAVAPRVSPLYYDRGQQVAHMQWPQLLP